jgi:hypothetical protein
MATQAFGAQDIEDGTESQPFLFLLRFIVGGLFLTG